MPTAWRWHCCVGAIYPRMTFDKKLVPPIQSFWRSSSEAGPWMEQLKRNGWARFSPFKKLDLHQSICTNVVPPPLSYSFHHVCRLKTRATLIKSLGIT